MSGLKDSIRSEFSSWLFNARLEDGLSQADIVTAAKRSGYFEIHQTTLSRLEQGTQHPYLYQALCMSRILGRPLPEFSLPDVAPCPTCAGGPPAGFQCTTCGARGAL